MRLTLIALIATMAQAQAQAQAQAPSPGSGAGGAVGPSVETPRTSQGATPPGAPTGDTVGDQALRNAAGRNVIGKTETPATAVPGNTTAPDAGVRR